MTPTVAKPQGLAARRKLKEADSKLSTVGTRTGSEAGCGRRAGWEQRSPIVIQTHQVEPGGARGQIQHLTRGDLLGESRGEVSRGRSSEEVRQCGWSEGPKNQGTELGKRLRNRARNPIFPGRDNYGSHPGSAEGRGGGAAASPRRGIPSKGTGETSDRERCPLGSTAGYGKPYVRWCGRVQGRNPLHPTRSSTASRLS